MGEIKMLDCTLRDGAYIVDSMFGDSAITGIIKRLQSAKIDIIECGWLKDKEHKEGSTFFHNAPDLLPYLSQKKSQCEYVVMIDWDRYNLDSLSYNDGQSFDSIRVVFPRNKFREGIAVGKEVIKKGYGLCLQAANTLGYTDEELRELATVTNESGAKSLSVVDTFGAMYEDDLERIVSILDGCLNDDIALGFHSHNNQQLAFSNAIRFLNLLKDKKRNVIVDSSLCGMGRGAGNATTELMVNYVNNKLNGKYDIDSIMDAIDIYMKHFEASYKWGYSTEYCIAGMYCCHVNNIAYLTNNHRTSAKDMRSIIDSLSPSDRLKYDYDLLEQKFIENQSRKVEDSDTCTVLSQLFSGKKLVLIAPGNSSIKEISSIKAFIDSDRDNTVVIAVNALLNEYKGVYDYLFLTNYARYSYAKETKTEMFKGLNKILLSSVKNKPDDTEYVVNYEKAIKRGWKHFDNAVICCLRLLSKLDAREIYIAGFDGFKSSYNESYADKFLPTINPGMEWNELNEEIKDMFTDIKNKHKEIKIEFLTDSYYSK